MRRLKETLSTPVQALSQTQITNDDISQPSPKLIIDPCIV